MTCKVTRCGAFLRIEVEDQDIAHAEPFVIFGGESRIAILTAIEMNVLNPGKFIVFYEMVSGIQGMTSYMEVRGRTIVLRRRDRRPWGDLEELIGFCLEVFVSADGTLVMKRSAASAKGNRLQVVRR